MLVLHSAATIIVHETIWCILGWQLVHSFRLVRIVIIIVFLAAGFITFLSAHFIRISVVWVLNELEWAIFGLIPLDLFDLFSCCFANSRQCLAYFLSRLHLLDNLLCNVTAVTAINDLFEVFDFFLIKLILNHCLYWGYVICLWSLNSRHLF